jgi:hypothetical protein
MCECAVPLKIAVSFLPPPGPPFDRCAEPRTQTLAPSLSSGDCVTENSQQQATAITYRSRQCR